MILEETVVDLEFKNSGKRIYVCIYQNLCLCVSFFAESSPATCFLAQGFIYLETLAGSVKLPFLKALFISDKTNFKLTIVKRVII